MIIVIISWIITCLAIIARQLIYRKNKTGFIISIIANILFALYYILFAKEYASFVLMIVFTFQSVYGIYYWNKDRIKEGDEVTVEYKKRKVSGTIAALRPKSFSIITKDGTKIWRFYNAIVH